MTPFDDTYPIKVNFEQGCLEERPTAELPSMGEKVMLA